MTLKDVRFGQVPEGWERNPLAEILVTMSSGSRPSGGGKSDGQGVFSVGGEHITRWGTLDCSNVVLIPHEYYTRIRTYASIQHGDILINKDGANTGKVALARDSNFPDPACINEHVFRLRAHPDKISQSYLFYFLFSDYGQSQIDPLVQGSAQPGLNQRFPNRVLILFPASKDEQALIVGVLGAVDFAIERTRGALCEAKKLKGALLQRFFFRALGEAAYADRPKKKLPKGWELLTTESLLAGDPKNGVSPKASSQPPGIPTFSIAAVREGRIDLNRAENLKYVQIPEAVAGRFRVSRGDVLIVRGNANPNLVGKAGMIDRFPEGCIYPDITKRVVFRREGERIVSPEFAVLAWNHSVVHNQVLRRAKTSNGTLKINNRDVKQIVMPVPPSDEQLTIVELTAAVESKILALNSVMQAQEQIKRSLMHDLLTGKVRVKNVGLKKIPNV